jgi:hypothetical protein
LKRRILGVLLAAALAAAVLPVLSSPAAAESNAYTPQNVSAKLMGVDQTHPKGSVLLTFTIADLPRDTDAERWQVAIDKKVGDGAWAGVSSENTSVYLDSYARGGGVYQVEQLWAESTEWDGTSTIFYGIYVVLYDASGNVVAQSAYSRVTPAGLETSDWAETEVSQAAQDGLVPESIKSKDLTAPITREEFCELAVLLYEKTSGEMARPASPNPFSDTANPEILKAYALEITLGMTPTTFEP